MEKRVDYAQADGIARITMDDGKLNVMSSSMLEELNAAFDRAEQEELTYRTLASGTVEELRNAFRRALAASA